MISWDVLLSSYLEYKIIRYWGLLQVKKGEKSTLCKILQNGKKCQYYFICSEIL